MDNFLKKLSEKLGIKVQTLGYADDLNALKNCKLALTNGTAYQQCKVGNNTNQIQNEITSNEQSTYNLKIQTSRYNCGLQRKYKITQKEPKIKYQLQNAENSRNNIQDGLQTQINHNRIFLIATLYHNSKKNHKNRSSKEENNDYQIKHRQTEVLIQRRISMIQQFLAIELISKNKLRHQIHYLKTQNTCSNQDGVKRFTFKHILEDHLGLTYQIFLDSITIDGFKDQCKDRIEKELEKLQEQQIIKKRIQVLIFLSFPKIRVQQQQQQFSQGLPEEFREFFYQGGELCDNQSQ